MDRKGIRWIGLNVFAMIARVLIPLINPLFDMYLRLRRPEDYRYFHIRDLAWEAFDQGDYPTAAALSQEYLLLNDRRAKNWNTGNAIHEANQILGLIALEEQNIPKAKLHLRTAGNTPGSPQLDSFGPRMVLARELLRRGERDVVVEYLESVRRFWTSDSLPPILDYPVFTAENRRKAELLEEWKKQARDGVVPDHQQWTRRGNST